MLHIRGHTLAGPIVRSNLLSGECLFLLSKFESVCVCACVHLASHYTVSSTMLSGYANGAVRSILIDKRASIVVCLWHGPLALHIKVRSGAEVERQPAAMCSTNTTYRFHFQRPNTFEAHRQTHTHFPKLKTRTHSTNRKCI